MAKTHRVRFQYFGGDTYYQDFPTLEMAQEQARILQEDILRKVRTELFDMEPTHVKRKSPVKGKKRKKAQKADTGEEVLTIEAFLEAYRSGEIKKDEKTFTLYDKGVCSLSCCDISAEAIYEGLCHTEKYFDKDVTSLKRWTKQNWADAVALESESMADAIEDSVERFVKTAHCEYTVR